MQDYAERQEAKRERYRRLAANKTVEGKALHDAGTKALEQIPFGQPILVGHYSERADRAYRSRATAKIDKAFKAMDAADYYASKADSVGTGGISSDDPEAIAKLKEKLAGMESDRERIKKDNATAHAAGKTTDDWVLKNLGANIRRVKERIEQLEKAKEEPTRPDIIRAGYRVTENKEEGRIQIFFDRKPKDEICKELKARGFRWSPTNKAWQCYLTNRGRYQTDALINIFSTQTIWV